MKQTPFGRFRSGQAVLSHFWGFSSLCLFARKCPRSDMYTKSRDEELRTVTHPLQFEIGYLYSQFTRSSPDVLNVVALYSVTFPTPLEWSRCSSLRVGFFGTLFLTSFLLFKRQ
eukprot:5853181-Amphidinium_carterae.1